MNNNFKLTKAMDLIKIYEEGNFQAFKEAYVSFFDGLDYFLELHEQIIEEYFPEFLPPKVDTTKISLEDFKNLDVERYEPTDYLIRGDGIKDRLHMYEDSIIDEYEELAHKYLGPKLPKRNYAYSCVPEDEIGKEFASKYLVRSFKHYYYKTIKEDAIKLGYDEVVKFIDDYPCYDWDLKCNYLDKLREKLKNIRLNDDLSEEELAYKLNLTEEVVKDLEKDGFPDFHVILQYARYEGITFNELLEYDYLIDMFDEDEEERLDEFLGYYGDSLPKYDHKLN